MILQIKSHIPAHFFLSMSNGRYWYLGCKSNELGHQQYFSHLREIKRGIEPQQF